MPAPPRFPLRHLIPLAALIGCGVLFLVLGGGRYLSFSALADHRQWLLALVARRGALAVLLFVAAYVALVAMSVPGGALLTMAGGFLFGPWLGTLYSAVGGTIGATIIFLAARAGLGGLMSRAGPWVQRFEAGFRRNSLSYLLVLRLIPVIPFWLINLVAGAVGVSLRVFVPGTLFGVIPVTFAYANLGSGLSAIIAEGRRPGLALLLHPNLLVPLIGLAALALLPILYQRWRGRIAERRDRAHQAP